MNTIIIILSIVCYTSMGAFFYGVAKSLDDNAPFFYYVSGIFWPIALLAIVLVLAFSIITKFLRLYTLIGEYLGKPLSKALYWCLNE